MDGAGRRGRQRPASPPRTPAGAARLPERRSAAHRRFREGDRERAQREWKRYEGTAQRELFRQLRERFLVRHARQGHWALDAGAGPGRFSPFVGSASVRCVSLDLSPAMVELGRELAAGTGADRPRTSDPVIGDAVRPPFVPGAFAEVALLGNALGFETRAGPRLLDAVESLVAPGGTLLVEIAPGPGERSRYLARLPAGAVRRLLTAPPAAVRPRLEREGFAVEPERHEVHAFRRWTVEELHDRWTSRGWTVGETVAVAPALGPDGPRLEEAARDDRAWGRLVELEEVLGRSPARWGRAAAVLLSAERPLSPTKTIGRAPPSPR